MSPVSGIERLMWHLLREEQSGWKFFAKYSAAGHQVILFSGELTQQRCRIWSRFAGTPDQTQRRAREIASGIARLACHVDDGFEHRRRVRKAQECFHPARPNAWGNHEVD